MKVADCVLAAVVVALGTFVGVQTHGQKSGNGTEAAGTIVTATTTDAETTARATETRDARDVRAGRAEGRLADETRYVRDVPRDAAWPASDMRRRLAQGESGTYIGSLLAARDSIITRWPDRRLVPLRVWVGEAGMEESWDPQFPAVVRDAFEEWVATGIPVRFSYVRDSVDADVRVRFVPQFAQGISGRTVWSRDSAWWLVAGDVELAINHPQGGAVSASQLRAIALHEVGHLLGLDHVDDATHIMAPRVRARALSDADVATVQLLYSVPAGSARN